MGHGASSTCGARSPLTFTKGSCRYTEQVFAESRCGCCCDFRSGEGLATAHCKYLKDLGSISETSNLDLSFGTKSVKTRLSTRERDRSSCWVLVGRCKRKRALERGGPRGFMLWKWIFKKQDWRAYFGFFWLKVGIRGKDVVNVVMEFEFPEMFLHHPAKYCF